MYAFAIGGFVIYAIGNSYAHGCVRARELVHLNPMKQARPAGDDHLLTCHTKIELMWSSSVSGRPILSIVTYRRWDPPN